MYIRQYYALVIRQLNHIMGGSLLYDAMSLYKTINALHLDDILLLGTESFCANAASSDSIPT